LPQGKAANRTSDQARERKGNGLPGDRSHHSHLRGFSMLHDTVGLKNREANVLDFTDILTNKDALLVTITKS
jgi:hypothetical protein